MKFTRNANLVEAYQFTGDPEMPGWPKDWLTTTHEFTAEGGVCVTRAGGARFLVRRGDWLVGGLSGEFVPYTPAQFAATYVPIQESN